MPSLGIWVLSPHQGFDVNNQGGLLCHSIAPGRGFAPSPQGGTPPGAGIPLFCGHPDTHLSAMEYLPLPVSLVRTR